jgi:hypothetical protein|tara:strand:- start:83 stop:313 length:231 start_codon:yes stop_codon:yes gene_type:complete
MHARVHELRPQVQVLAAALSCCRPCLVSEPNRARCPHHSQAEKKKVVAKPVQAEKKAPMPKGGKQSKGKPQKGGKR